MPILAGPRKLYHFRPIIVRIEVASKPANFAELEVRVTFLSYKYSNDTEYDSLATKVILT